MKNIFILLLLLSLGTSCDNDDGNAINESQCNYQGFSYFDNNNNDQTLIPEMELNTQHFPNASNGPYGEPGIEIASFTSSPTLFFTTNVIELNETGPGWISINGAELEEVTVTCQRAGTAVGDEVRLDVIYNSMELEFCVIIDEVL